VKRSEQQDALRTREQQLGEQEGECERARAADVMKPSREMTIGLESERTARVPRLAATVLEGRREGWPSA
jgi:hypothetical protein